MIIRGTARVNLVPQTWFPYRYRGLRVDLQLNPLRAIRLFFPEKTLAPAQAPAH